MTGQRKGKRREAGVGGNKQASCTPGRESERDGELVNDEKPEGEERSSKRRAVAVTTKEAGGGRAPSSQPTSACTAMSRQLGLKLLNGVSEHWHLRSGSRRLPCSSRWLAALRAQPEPVAASSAQTKRDVLDIKLGR